MTTIPATMRAWRTHEYGEPVDVLKLDTVPVPEPGPGEVLVRALGIPFNLNDLERINGGNMMVRPDLPYSPGMETMGIVAACGEGTEAMLGTARGRDHATGARRVRRVRDLSGGLGVRDARRHPAARRGGTVLPVPPRVARPLRPRRPPGGRDRARPRRGRRRRVGGDPARGRQGRARDRHGGIGREDPAVPRPRRADGRELPHRGVRQGLSRADRRQGRRRGLRQRRRGGDGGLVQVAGVQRPLPHDGVRVGQDGRRREDDRAAAHRRSGTSSCAA